MSQASSSLYTRLGGREGITRITHDLMSMHLANPVVKTRFENAADLARAERHAVEFFCAGAGGPEAYTGRDMVTTHKGMNISEQEFVAVVDDAMAALERNGIDAPTRAEVLAIFWSLKSEVVRL